MNQISAVSIVTFLVVFMAWVKITECLNKDVKEVTEKAFKMSKRKVWVWYNGFICLSSFAFIFIILWMGKIEYNAILVSVIISIIISLFPLAIVSAANKIWKWFGQMYNEKNPETVLELSQWDRKMAMYLSYVCVAVTGACLSYDYHLSEYLIVTASAVSVLIGCAMPVKEALAMGEGTTTAFQEVKKHCKTFWEKVNRDFVKTAVLTDVILMYLCLSRRTVAFEKLAIGMGLGCIAYGVLFAMWGGKVMTEKGGKLKEELKETVQKASRTVKQEDKDKPLESTEAAASQDVSLVEETKQEEASKEESSKEDDVQESKKEESKDQSKDQSPIYLLEDKNLKKEQGASETVKEASASQQNENEEKEQEENNKQEETIPLYFVRHGETADNQNNKICGRSDSPLSSKGIEQAQQLAEQIAKNQMEIAVIYYSPLERAKQTAQIIHQVTGIPMKEDSRLIEQDFGVFEGKSRDDQAFIQAKKDCTNRFETGESMLQLSQRVYEFLDELREKKEPYLVVSHNGVGRVTESYFRTMKEDEFTAFMLENASLKRYDFTPKNHDKTDDDDEKEGDRQQEHMVLETIPQKEETAAGKRRCEIELAVALVEASSEILARLTSERTLQEEEEIKAKIEALCQDARVLAKTYQKEKVEGTKQKEIA